MYYITVHGRAAVRINTSIAVRATAGEHRCRRAQYTGKVAAGTPCTKREHGSGFLRALFEVIRVQQQKRTKEGSACRASLTHAKQVYISRECCLLTFRRSQARQTAPGCCTMIKNASQNNYTVTTTKPNAGAINQTTKVAVQKKRIPLGAKQVQNT